MKGKSIIKNLFLSLCFVVISFGVAVPKVHSSEANLTYYWIVTEPERYGSRDVLTPLYIVNTTWNDSGDSADYTIVETITTTLKFLKQVSTEGTGVLNSTHGKRMIGWGADCNESSTGVCFEILNRKIYPFGRGSEDNALIPWKSIATDQDIIPFGTSVYIPAFDGRSINFSQNKAIYNYLIKNGYMVDEDADYIIQHDGCFTADDVGGSIVGEHIDIFAVRTALYNQVRSIVSSQYSLNDPKCTGEESPPEPPAPSTEPPIVDSNATVYFITLSDWGDGSDEQREVANAMKQYCSREKCDFVVTLGDNFQDEPVTSVTDPLWNTIYKDVYGGLGLPFYVTLGNHDMDESWQVEINYSAVDPSWHLPSQDYTFGKPDTAPLIDFFVINTGDWEYESAEETWLKSALQKSSATWKFLLSHAPIISNGSEHGDMSIDFGYDDPAVNLVTDICGRIDLTLSGHDHIFSYLAGATFGCNIKQLVLGTGGGDLYDFNASDPRAIKSASMNGFGWFKVEKNQVTFRFIDTAGNVYYQTTWAK